MRTLRLADGSDAHGRADRADQAIGAAARRREKHRFSSGDIRRFAQVERAWRVQTTRPQANGPDQAGQAWPLSI